MKTLYGFYSGSFSYNINLNRDVCVIYCYNDYGYDYGRVREPTLPNIRSHRSSPSQSRHILFYAAPGIAGSSRSPAIYALVDVIARSMPISYAQ
jgi:hypothetical protein